MKKIVAVQEEASEPVEGLEETTEQVEEPVEEASIAPDLAAESEAENVQDEAELSADAAHQQTSMTVRKRRGSGPSTS